MFIRLATVCFNNIYGQDIYEINLNTKFQTAWVNERRVKITYLTMYMSKCFEGGDTTAFPPFNDLSISAKDSWIWDESEN